VPVRARLTFRLDWQECQEQVPIAEILLETSGRVSQVFQKVLRSCREPSKDAGVQSVNLNDFSSMFVTLVFRVPPAAGSIGSQRVGFTQVLLNQAKD